MMRYFKFSVVFVMALSLLACGGAEDRKLTHLKKGDDYFAEKDYEKARIEYKNVLQIDPKDAQARYSLGNVLMELNNWRKAIGNYKSAVELDPNHIDARIKLSSIYVRANLIDEANELIDQVLVLDPNNVDALTIRSAALLKNKDYEKAKADALKVVGIGGDTEQGYGVLARVESLQGNLAQAVSVLQEGISKNADSVALRFELANVYEKLELHDKIEPLLHKVIEIKPDNFQARLTLAKLYIKQKKLDDAEVVLSSAVKEFPDESSVKSVLAEFVSSYREKEKAIKLLKGFINDFPDDKSLQFTLAHVYLTLAPPDKEEAKTIYKNIVKSDGDELSPDGLKAKARLAQIYMAENEKSKAEKLLTDVLNENPNDGAALVMRALISLEQDNPQSAINDLRAALKNKQGSPQILLLLAKAHIANKETALAKESLQQAVEANPDNFQVLETYVKYLVSKGKLVNASRAVEPFVQKNPGNIQGQSLLIKLYLAQKDLPSALSASDNMKVALPNSSAGYIAAASIYQQQQKDTDKAINEIKTGLEVTKDTASLLPLLIKGYLSTDQKALAETTLDTMISEDTKAFVPRVLRGEIYLATKEYAKAEALFNEVIKIDPLQVVAYRNIALSKISQNKADDAIDVLQKGIEANPESNILIYALLSIYEREGRVDEAISRYENMLKDNPNQPIVINNLAMLLVTGDAPQQNLDRALELVEPLKKSTNAAFLDTVGWVYFERGEYKDAIEFSTMAVEKAPESGLLTYHLGMAHFKSGDMESAKEALTKAIESKDDFKEKEDAKKVLSEIK